MGNIFAGSEILELAIQIEKNGQDFYNALIKKSGSQEAQGVFRFLASEEEKHRQLFQGMLEKADKYEAIGLGADDYYAYMRALAGEHIFTQENKGEEAAATIKNDKEAVNLGIGFEKDSIVFYEGMEKMVAPYDAKIVNEVIAQEQQHLRKLVDLKAKL